MAARHRFQAGGEDCREIGSAIKGKAEQPRPGRLERKADERTAEIQEEELDEEWRAADDLDEEAQQPIDEDTAVAPRQGDCEAEDDGGERAGGPDPEGRRRRQDKLRAIGENEGKTEGHVPPARSRRSLSLPPDATIQFRTR